MTRLLLIMLTVFMLMASVPQAAKNVGTADVVVCTPKSAAHLSDDGSLVVEKPGGIETENILIDLHTGVVRQPPNGKPQTWWRVVQKGGESNDWVLTAFVDPREPLYNIDGYSRNLTRAVGDVLRVRHWNGQEQILFFQLALTRSLSGTCVTVK